MTKPPPDAPKANPSREPPEGKPLLLHATLVRVNGKGVLLQGPSAAGKSDLALRLITTSFAPAFVIHQPLLVADDQVEVTRGEAAAIGRAPATLKGLIEVRHLGIMKVPVAEHCKLDLVVSLASEPRPARLPAEGASIELLPGLTLPHLQLPAFEASTPLKIILATHQDAT